MRRIVHLSEDGWVFFPFSRSWCAEGCSGVVVLSSMHSDVFHHCQDVCADPTLPAAAHDLWEFACRAEVPVSPFLKAVPTAQRVLGGRITKRP